MEVTIFIDGEYKTFTVPFVNALTLRKSIEINKEIDFSNIQEEDLDKLVDFVVMAFNNQFTREEFYEGVPGKELLKKVDDVMAEAMGLNKKKGEGNEEDDSKNEEIPMK